MHGAKCFGELEKSRGHQRRSHEELRSAGLSNTKGVGKLSVKARLWLFRSEAEANRREIKYNRRNKN